MEKLRLVILLGSCVTLISSQTEDFAFEQDTTGVPAHTLIPLKRLWGIPDTKAQVGKFVQISVPADAFDGVINKYEVCNIILLVTLIEF